MLTLSDCDEMDRILLLNISSFCLFLDNESKTIINEIFLIGL